VGYHPFIVKPFWFFQCSANIYIGILLMFSVVIMWLLNVTSRIVMFYLLWTVFGVRWFTVNCNQ